MSTDTPGGQLPITAEFFQGAWKNDGLWSCCGYDGLSAVFAIPLERLHTLTEVQKRALMHLLMQLASGNVDLLAALRKLQNSPPDEWLYGLINLGSKLLSNE